jgi:beta-galactosidase
MITFYVIEPVKQNHIYTIMNYMQSFRVPQHRGMAICRGIIYFKVMKKFFSIMFYPIKALHHLRMKPFRMKPGHILTVLLLLAGTSIILAESSPKAKTAPTGTGNASTVSLAGKWRFALDRKGVGVDERWFGKDLSDAIQLPGNIESQGYGDEITGQTPWTSSVAAKVYWERLTHYAKYRQPDNVKIPFWWQPERYYVGRAWFQRDIDVPVGWSSSRLALMLERVHIQSQVWLDDRPLGLQNSLYTPHRYELGVGLTPGKHRLTICVDNRLLPEFNVGTGGHGVADHTQGNWNGVVGRIELSASSPVWIDDVQAYPNFAARQTRLKVRLGNATGKPGSGTIRAGGVSAPISWTADGGIAELTLPFGEKSELWDEFNPKLRHVNVVLDAGKFKDERYLTFGLRKIEAGEDLFIINGRKSYLRGTLECAVFPLTGYPPTDVPSWKRIISVAQSYGLNYMRFHSWCPPKAAFIAADELGFYLRPEIAWSMDLGKGTPLDEWMLHETGRIFREYGNHPSFILMQPSNEPFSAEKTPAFMRKWLAYAKDQDPRRLYSGNCCFPRLPEDEFSVEGNARGAGGWHGGDYRRGLEFLDAKKDVNGGKLLGKPVLLHEMTQYQAYPNYDEIAKYTGNRKARYLEIFRDDLKASGMLDQAHDFLIASGKLQVLCIKEDIEAAMRTRGYSGFEMLGLTDFPGQGVSFCGVLDVFWDSKGYVTPEAYRRFCNTTVPLVRLTREAFTQDDTLEVKAEIAHFGKEPLKSALPEWKVLDASGKQVAGKTWSARMIDLGLGTDLGSIQLPLKALKAPGKYRLVVGINGTMFQNDWNFWVYPSAPIKNGRATALSTTNKLTTEDPLASSSVSAEAGANAVSGETGIVELPSGPIAAPSVSVSTQTTLNVSPEAMERSVLVTSTLSPRALSVLNQGGRVLLLPSKRREIPPQFPRGEFQPVFWNKSVWQGGGSSETLGLLCNPQHPALSQFPTDFYSDWQWADLIQSSRWLVLDGLPAELRPIVEGIDYQYTSRRLAMVFECRVGSAGGKLLVCAADLQRDLEKRPAARQLRRSLIDYLAGDRCKPKIALTVDQLSTICGRDPLPMPPCKAVADSDGGQQYDAAKAVDGDLSTYWHSAWSKNSPLPHYLTLEFEQPKTFAGLTCVPNTRNTSGWIRQYAVQISPDGQAWTEIAKGEFPQDAAEKVVTFAAPVTARFLKFQVLSGWDRNSPLASLAELTLVPAKP